MMEKISDLYFFNFLSRLKIHDYPVPEALPTDHQTRINSLKEQLAMGVDLVAIVSTAVVQYSQVLSVSERIGLFARRTQLPSHSGVIAIMDPVVSRDADTFAYELVVGEHEIHLHGYRRMGDRKGVYVNSEILSANQKPDPTFEKFITLLCMMHFGKASVSESKFLNEYFDENKERYSLVKPKRLLAVDLIRRSTPIPLESAVKSTEDGKICINIWDDYVDDGQATDDQRQDTYIYIEGTGLPHEKEKQYLSILLQHISTHLDLPGVALRLNFYEAKSEYPHLCGTDHEASLYDRWEIDVKNLTHQRRERLVEELAIADLSADGLPFEIHSGS